MLNFILLLHKKNILGAKWHNFDQKVNKIALILANIVVVQDSIVVRMQYHSVHITACCIL